jgi:hypothetical protein
MMRCFVCENEAEFIYDGFGMCAEHAKRGAETQESDDMKERRLMHGCYFCGSLDVQGQYRGEKICGECLLTLGHKPYLMRAR